MLSPIWVLTVQGLRDSSNYASQVSTSQVSTSQVSTRQVSANQDCVRFNFLAVDNHAFANLGVNGSRFARLIELRQSGVHQSGLHWSGLRESGLHQSGQHYAGLHQSGQHAV
jgi:hypothetical protein